MPDDSLQLFGRGLSGVSQVDFVMMPPFRNVERIPLLFHEAMHKLHSRGLIIVWADMQTLNADSFIISQELYLREVRFLFFLLPC